MLAAPAHFDVDALAEVLRAATLLLAEAERRIAARGLRLAHLAVEPDDDRARRLYEHLGYVAFGEREHGWEQEDEHGTLGWYATTVVDMEKPL